MALRQDVSFAPAGASLLANQSAATRARPPGRHRAPAARVAYAARAQPRRTAPGPVPKWRAKALLKPASVAWPQRSATVPDGRALANRAVRTYGARGMVPGGRS